MNSGYKCLSPEKKTTLKLDNIVYSSSESGVNDLEIDLVAILWDNGLISKDLVCEIYGKEKKIKKIIERLKYLQVVAQRYI